MPSSVGRPESRRPSTIGEAAVLSSSDHQSSDAPGKHNTYGHHVRCIFSVWTDVIMNDVTGIMERDGGEYVKRHNYK